MNLNDIDDAEKFQKHFVIPLVDAVRAEVKPLVDGQAKHEARIKALEATRRRSKANTAAVMTLVTGVGAAIWSWLKGKGNAN